MKTVMKAVMNAVMKAVKKAQGTVLLPLKNSRTKGQTQAGLNQPNKQHMTLFNTSPGRSNTTETEGNAIVYKYVLGRKYY
ncbi:MAG: hypothetical protein JSS86_19360 [Cyanobacteria bacterium SZAS LIN-2]|nr:hypothetical protein [Cyanobacteria bacterium SZAS LIN-3]MBS1998496.1 hypothetical protein [Cyanobacteria bacterium SZAS LIN-2]